MDRNEKFMSSSRSHKLYIQWKISYQSYCGHIRCLPIAKLAVVLELATEVYSQGTTLGLKPQHVSLALLQEYRKMFTISSFPGRFV